MIFCTDGCPRFTVISRIRKESVLMKKFRKKKFELCGTKFEKVKKTTSSETTVSIQSVMPEKTKRFDLPPACWWI